MTRTIHPVEPAAAVGERPRPRRRRPVVALLVALLAVVLLVGVGWLLLVRDTGQPAPPAGASGWEPRTSSELQAAEDALHRRSLAELTVFTDWLQLNQAEGYIGEVGIPGGDDLDRWMLLAQRWFTAADEAGLWVDVWSVGEWWRQGYTYSPFVSPADGGALGITREQGDLLAWAASTTDLPRGVNLSGGEFGATGGSDARSEFSNHEPGRYDRDYHYDSQESLDYLAAQGIDTVRLPFRWERIQPELGGPLDPRELHRLYEVVERADRAGLQVILDVHNFGAYFLAEGDAGVRHGIGSAELPAARFADLWDRLSDAFEDVPGVLAYDLMNEPVYLPDLGVDLGTADRAGAQVWEGASQAAVDAVRARGDGTLIMVSGYGYAHVGEWTRWHPEAWIDDPADNVRYTAHHYWSPERGVAYGSDLAKATEDGY